MDIYEKIQYTLTLTEKIIEDVSNLRSTIEEIQIEDIKNQQSKIKKESKATKGRPKKTIAITNDDKDLSVSIDV